MSTVQDMIVAAAEHRNQNGNNFMPGAQAAIEAMFEAQGLKDMTVMALSPHIDEALNAEAEAALESFKREFVR